MEKPSQRVEQSETPKHRVAPPVDVFEDKDQYRVFVDLPGVAQDAVTLTVEREELTLIAERRGPTAVEYQRSFRIPEAIDVAKIQAKLNEGVLEVQLPKAESVKPRRIAVTAG